VTVTRRGDAGGSSSQILRARGVTDDDGWSYVEAVEKLAARVIDVDHVLGAGAAHDPFAWRLREAFYSRLIVPGTPLLSAGRVSGAPTPTACTVLGASPEGMPRDVRSALEQGAGVGVDLSAFDDPISAITDLNELVREIDRELIHGRRRPVAAMGTLSSRHPRIMDFIGLKRNADFSQWRFNLSVRLEGDISDWDHLLPAIADAAHFCGEPGILFWDRFVHDNPLPWSPPVSTAPCAEVALAPGEGCVFTYVNLAQLWNGSAIDWQLLEKVTDLSIRLLDAAVEMQTPGNLTAVSRVTRRVGVGVMGFADLCILAGAVYGEAKSVAIAREVAARITASAIAASTDLARARGAFEGFLGSKWADPTWAQEVVTRAVGDVLPDRADALVAAIASHGLRHSHLVAFPPTGNSSRLAGVSQAIEPRRMRILGGDGQYHSAHEAALRQAAKARPWVDVTDLSVSPAQHVAIQAAFQQSTIDAVSKTVNAPRDATVEQIEQLIRLAWASSCKGVTVFRDGCLEDRAA
jgi:ribonucleoside-diphosphate reductase alpha chain